MSTQLPMITELHQYLHGIWLSDQKLPDTLTFKLFGQCKNFYIAEKEDLKEPLVLHVLGYIAPIPFLLTLDNGFQPEKGLPPWCQTPFQALMKSSAWCWLEPIPDTSPITDDFSNIVKNMQELESMAKKHAEASLKNKITVFGGTVTDNGMGSIVLKHAMIFVSSKYL